MIEGPGGPTAVGGGRAASRGSCDAGRSHPSRLRRRPDSVDFGWGLNDDTQAVEESVENVQVHG